VLRVDSDEYPDNTIIEELRRGYYIKDKVIRPSMVKVAKSI
jgi:molecular chaperone GrpE